MSEIIKISPWGKIIKEKNIMRGLKEVETDNSVTGYISTVNFANKNLSKEALNFTKNCCDGKHYFFKETDSDLWMILAYELSDIHTDSFNKKNYSKGAFKMSLEYALSEKCPKYAKEKGFYIDSFEQKTNINKNDENKSNSYEDKNTSYENKEDIFNEDLNIEELLKELYDSGYNNEKVEKIIKFNSNSQRLFFDKGAESNKEKRYLDAIRFFLECLSISINDITLYNLGTVYLREEKYILAAKCLKKAIELKSSDSRYFYNLGVTLFKIDKKKYVGKSLIYFKHSLLLNPYDEGCKKTLLMVEDYIADLMNNDI